MGEVPRLMVLIPRSRIFVLAPGDPLVELICAPGIFPISAWSTEAVGAGGSLSDVTDSTEMASFFLLVATPTPVTTTSLSDLLSYSRLTVTGWPTFTFSVWLV
jgi:hypothetical protein